MLGSPVIMAPWRERGHAPRFSDEKDGGGVGDAERVRVLARVHIRRVLDDAVSSQAASHCPVGVAKWSYFWYHKDRDRRGGAAL